MWLPILFGGLGLFLGNITADKGFPVLTGKRYRLKLKVAKAGDYENARKYLEQVGFTDVDPVVVDPSSPTCVTTAGTWSRAPLTISLDFPALKLCAVEVIG